MKIKTLFISLFMGLCALNTAHAATVTLKDDRQLEGEILSQTKEALVIEVDGIEMTLPINMVKSIDLFSAPVEAAAKAPKKAPKAKPANGPVTLPEGTPLRITMDKSVNSRQHKTGHRFTAKLEANLMAGDVMVAPRGAVVHGVLSNVKSGGRIAGSAEMSLVLTDIMINNNMVVISTATSDGKGPNAAKDTIGKTARAAAIGGLIDGSDGAKTGAKVGAGVALLTRNSDIQIAQGTLLDFTLNKALVVK